MFLDLTYKQARENVRHLKALGVTVAHLDYDESVPWHLVNEVQEAGSHRLDMCTSLRFCAHDESGMGYSWCFDLEPREANGSGSYHLDTPGIISMANKLPPAPRRRLAEILAESAVKVRDRAVEYENAANRQFADANALDKLVRRIGEA